MTASLETPRPPPQIWSQLEQQLGREHIGRIQPADHKTPWTLARPRLIALAATVLVVVGVGWIGFTAWFGRGLHDRFTVEFGHYLEEFDRDPTAAQQFLLAKYNGEAIDVQQAVHRVGYRPAIADGLPEGYAVESTHMMEMPCCTCVQSFCTRRDGSTIVVFEHDDENTTQWFGDRPEASTTCDGKQCSLVELDDNVAASWKRDNRYITMIGVRDLAEVDQLIAWFDERQQSRMLQ